ncbi:hypothetical protein GCM10009675_06870 [Prauserella alba]|uniref:Uncharacterized protein n=1 Tax=Prauserella alba TaxID=176898 RepID=A0ABP4FTH1_9PSEU
MASLQAGCRRIITEVPGAAGAGPVAQAGAQDRFRAGAKRAAADEGLARLRPVAHAAHGKGSAVSDTVANRCSPEGQADSDRREEAVPVLSGFDVLGGLSSLLICIPHLLRPVCARRGVARVDALCADGRGYL